MAQVLKFENVGRGLSLAGLWVEIAGHREWVTLTAATNAPLGHRAQAGKWECAASFMRDGKAVRAVASITSGHREDAARLAISGLTREPPAV